MTAPSLSEILNETYFVRWRRRNGSRMTCRGQATHWRNYSSSCCHTNHRKAASFNARTWFHILNNSSIFSGLVLRVRTLMVKDTEGVKCRQRRRRANKTHYLHNLLRLFFSLFFFLDYYYYYYWARGLEMWRSRRGSSLTCVSRCRSCPVSVTPTTPPLIFSVDGRSQGMKWKGGGGQRRPGVMIRVAGGDVGRWLSDWTPLN